MQVTILPISQTDSVTQPPISQLSPVTVLPASLVDIGGNIAFTYLSIILALSGMIVNFITILAFFKCHRLRAMMNEVLVNLAVADLLHCVTFSTNLISTFVPSLRNNQNYCLLRTSVINTGCVASLLSLVLVTVERVVVIVYPFNCSLTGTLPGLRFIIGAIWAYSIITGFLVFAWNKLPKVYNSDNL